LLKKRKEKEKNMNTKSTVAKIALISILLMTFIVFMGAAQPYNSSRSAYVDQHWFSIIISADEYLLALLEHDIDLGGVPRPDDLDDLQDAGFTITTTTELGYTFFMTNNRRWPLGPYSYDDPTYGKCGWGTPNEPMATEAKYFRKALGRLIDLDYIVGEIYAPVMSECEYFLPPGSAYWINPDAPGSAFNPGSLNDAFPLETASAYLNEGGFTPGSTPNEYEDADTDAPYYSATLRIDPNSSATLEPFEYYAIGPSESPLGYEMATDIVEKFHTAGLPCTLVAGTWDGMVARLVNSELNDYQIMTGVGIVWGSPAPDILYDFTYSLNLPLWNFVSMNHSVVDGYGEDLMSTLHLATARQAAYDIQAFLSDFEPYKPMLLWENFVAETGPYESEPGMIGIVNYKGKGPGDSTNVWGKQFTRAGRTAGGYDINKWGLGSYLDTLNPLMADTVPDWQCLNNLFEGFYSRNPYTLEYKWAGAVDMPTIEEWVGPGGSVFVGGTDTAGAEYDNAFNGTHYAGIGTNEIAETPQPDPYPCEPWNITDILAGDDEIIPVANVTAAHCAGDDTPGVVTTWTLRPGQYWHDSDAGADGKLNTTDDGTTYPVTTADAEFGFNLLKYQENVRYMTQWIFLYAVEVYPPYEIKVYEERRFLFGFEGHDVCLLAPKHLWENYIHKAGAPAVHDDGLEVVMACGNCSAADYWDFYSEDDSGYLHHHDERTDLWTQVYKTDPNNPDFTLTYLIGNGPFVYHSGGWVPGDSVHVETWGCYFGGHICPSDIDFNSRCEPATDDVNKLLQSIGSYPAANYLVECDTTWPCQVVDLSEISLFLDHSGHYWGPDPVPDGFTRCPHSTVD